ncbi:DUF2512 family protein [Bacillus sp. ISL-47]|uniref:DUF2512 family protein n=1 Tax=Bacillus sp. ISL-47 TaxID=2819130 RepID=UPI001BE689EE|nr:DUF2512 family protein [Bacillus sp. ISL-47]MBT2691158.1 DUF2512 family protein [Bacillus sp. ISL-47]MBT2711054.1 DUF2512 family protein [Pseudomonas sp. ISL-84]
MEHVKAILIKLLMITAVLGIVLTGFFDIGFTETLIISFVLTLAAYVLGDMMIFRMAGDETEHTKRNAIATVSDIGLSFFVIWLLEEMIVAGKDNLTLAAFVSALVIGAGEWFFHGYLDNRVFHNDDAHN